MQLYVALAAWERTGRKRIIEQYGVEVEGTDQGDKYL